MAIMPHSFTLRARTLDDIVILGLNRHGYGGRGVYLYREDLELEFKWLQDFVSETDTFIDIGANTGIYTLKAAKYASRGTVISLEPQIETLAMLERSVRENGFDNIRLRNLAASDTMGLAQLCLLHGLPVSASIANQTAEDQCQSVLTVTVDALLEWENIQHVDYIKIDAEGAELMILKGAAKTIERCRPLIQCEDTIADMKGARFPGYVTLKHPGSPNVIFAPADHKKMPAFLNKGFVPLGSGLS